MEGTSSRLLLPVQSKDTSTYRLIVRILDILNDYTEYSINVTVRTVVVFLNAITDFKRIFYASPVLIRVF